MEFSGQEYWSGAALPSPGKLTVPPPENVLHRARCVRSRAGQGVGPGDPACSQLRPERLLAGGLSGPGSLGAGRTEDQGCARGAGGQGF